MSPRYILAFVAIIFVSVFGFGYATTRQPTAQVEDTQTVATNDQASVQTATTPTPSDDDDEDDDDRAGTSQPTQPTTQPSSGTTQSSSFTMAQVKTHNSSKSCWAVVSGKVYDLTAWINNHPGGPGPILSLCGTDGTAAFSAQHSGQARPSTELAKFNIGTLVQ